MVKIDPVPWWAHAERRGSRVQLSPRLVKFYGNRDLLTHNRKAVPEIPYREVGRQNPFERKKCDCGCGQPPGFCHGKKRASPFPGGRRPHWFYCSKCYRWCGLVGKVEGHSKGVPL